MKYLSVILGIFGLEWKLKNHIEKTLAERYGYEYLFGEMNKKSRFYDHTILYP